MGETEFLGKLAELLQLERGAVTREMPLEEGTLDSLAMLSTIAAIDEEYGVTVPTAKLKACRTVGEILALAEAA